MEQYRYQRLDHGRPTFRLLRLHQGNRGELTCNLVEALLHHDDLIQYEALSYTWGAPATPRSITVDEQKLAITESLYQALTSLRLLHSDRILWIDAICIDQGNKKERSHQVAQMSDIYKQADCVIFFLGRATYQTDAFMEYMCHVQEERNKHAWRSWASNDQRWRSAQEAAEAKMDKPDIETLSLGLRSLLNRSWFLRVWILQEVANAKNAIVCCGRKEIAASVFSIAPVLLGVSPSLHCQSVIDIMPGPWRKASWWSKSPCLYTLLLKFGGSQATESRDLVYALRGIATDKESSILMPDYDKSEECLVRDVVKFLFNFDYDARMSWSMLATIRDAIRSLDKIKDRIFMERIRADEANLLEILLRSPGFTPSPAIVDAAIQYGKTGQTMKMLIKYHPEGCEMDTGTLLTAVAKGAVPVVTVLEQHLGIKVVARDTEEILLAAANNQCHGGDMLNYVLPRSRGLDDYTRVAEVAASNSTQAVAIIRQLLDRGSRITTTPLLCENAFKSGCFPDVLKLLIHCPSAGSQIDVNAMKSASVTEDVRATFRIIAKLLVSYATYADSIFDILRHSGRQIEAHGYNFLEELVACAVEVLKEGGDSDSKRREQFAKLTGTLDWAAEESGLDLWITIGVVNASVHFSFQDWIFSVLLGKGDSVTIDPGAAAMVIAICFREHRPDLLLVTEHILLYREGRLRHNKVVLEAFKKVYCRGPQRKPRSMQLHDACSRNYLQSSKLLLSLAADTEERDFLGNTALTTACLRGQLRIQALLLSYGANPNTHTHGHCSLLHLAVMSRHYGLVELLLVYGANPNMSYRCTYQGRTPLMAAVFADDVWLVRLLLRYGADTAARNLQGQSAECLAKSDAVVLLLRKHLQRSFTGPIKISPRIQQIMKEFGLVSKPYGRLLGTRPLWHARELDNRLHARWRRKTLNSAAIEGFSSCLPHVVGTPAAPLSCDSSHLYSSV